MGVSTNQRFTADKPCPVCGGYEGAERGNGSTCYGFISGDGRYAHCSREEFAADLEVNPNSETYAHYLGPGRCRCGETHGGVEAPTTNGSTKEKEKKATGFTTSKFGGRVIDVAKSRVECLDLADLLCGPGQMRKSASTWIARCPLPDHQDNFPSFAVYPNTGWYCFGCDRGGDVVHLAALAWGYSETQMAGAAAELLHAFGYGHEIPKRPAGWHRKQERQAPVRAAIEQTRKNIIRRRLFKYCIMPMLERIDDPDEHAKEAKRAWRDLKEVLP